MSNDVKSLWNEIHDSGTNNKINQYIQNVHHGQYGINQNIENVDYGENGKIDLFYNQIENDLRRYIVFTNWYIDNIQTDVKNNIRNIANSTDTPKINALYKLFHDTCNIVYKKNDLGLLCMQIIILLEDNESNHFREEYEKQNGTKKDYALNIGFENPNIHIYVTSNEISIIKQIIYNINYMYIGGDDAVDDTATEITKKQKYYSYKLVSQEISEYLYDILSSIQEKAFYYIMNKKQMSRTDNPAAKNGIFTTNPNNNYCNIDFTDEISKYEGTVKKSTGKALAKFFTGKMSDHFKTFINELIANKHFDKYKYDTVVKKLPIFSDTELQEIYKKYENIFAHKMPMIKNEDQTQNSNACKELFMRTFSNTQDETAFLCYCILLYNYYETQHEDVMQLKKYICSRYILQYAPTIIQKYENTDKYILPDIEKWYINVSSITQYDIVKSIIDNAQQKQFQLYPPMYGKISQFFEKYIQKNSTNLNPVLDTERFNHVYITSDIHADLRKFTQTLINNGIIEIKKSDGSTFEPYSDDIYLPELITNIIWKNNKTLLVIIGDLVDGKLSREKLPDGTKIYKQVDDPEGSFELRLHMFLYNMRIQAMQHNSEVRFTLGNHDIISVLSKLTGKHVPDYSNYVHDTLLQFYQKNHENKQNSLIPFYKCSPYLYLALQKKSNQYEVFCVHGGVDSVKNEHTTYEDISWLKNMQNEYINTIQKTNIITSNRNLHEICDDGDYTILDESLFTTRPFYSRMYADSNIEADRNIGTKVPLAKSHRTCENIPENINMLVVGHCITHGGGENSRLKQFYDNRTNESQCKHRGCIAYGCKNENTGMYRLIFVDTGMARQNNDFESRNVQNQTRPIEMLYLKKAEWRSINEKRMGVDNTYEQLRTIAENPERIQNSDPLNNLVQNKQLGGKKFTKKNRQKGKTRRRQKYVRKRSSKKVFRKTVLEKNKRVSRKS